MDNLIIEELLNFCPREFTSASRQFKGLIERLIEIKGVKSCIEMGGGRDPIMSYEEVSKRGIDYIVNDVSMRELEMCDDRFSKLHGNLADLGPVGVDLIFSRMVYEHVDDNERLMRALLGHLNPGGMVLHLHPALGSPPFILNKLLPEIASQAILRAFFKNRTDDGTPKFPARYDNCWATRSQERRILDWGYSYVSCVPFWGHNYYDKIPVVGGIEKISRRIFMELRLRHVASFCYTFAVK
ncbi:class I SAM-dependent methyltransferase [Abyssibacter profundi]|uniref:Class I SAM-dependent methyltransferase n=1 Tax=Abyssibacter profundi TaxID=2182787 RepID=A0A383XPM1_9GAMM|nr:methyltransferase domain-containing protein [Abyssibacter profundi]PWN54575.1 hypothetical protein DEH80_16575 [Abyssibacter profundi]